MQKLVTMAIFALHTPSEWVGGEVWPQAQAYTSTDLRQNCSCLCVGDGIFWLGKARSTKRSFRAKHTSPSKASRRRRRQSSPRLSNVRTRSRLVKRSNQCRDCRERVDGWTVVTLKETLQELANQSKKARSSGRRPEKDLSVREWNGAVKSWEDAVAASVCREGSTHPIDLLVLPNYLDVSVLIPACDTYRSLRAE